MKRSNSAPLIPDLVKAEIKAPPTTSNLLSRRGLSSSNVSLPTEIVIKTLFIESSPRKQPLSSPLPLSRINSPTSRLHRVEKLKKEENIDERDNEKEVQEQILLNKNCDELRLDSDEQDLRHEQMEVWPSLPSPSHQPLSPLASRMIRSRSLTPTSPSSTRSFSYRRSCSPVLRPSSLCFQIGHKRPRDHESQEDMDTSPSVPCKRLHLSYPSPLNLSPSISPLMNNSPLHQSFSSCSRKSSSTLSESTPLSSPSSLLQSTNPFAVNYDSGNCEHWQSNSGSNSNCSSACHSPSITGGHAGMQKGDAMSVSLFSSKLQGNLLQEDGGVPGHQFSYLCPSPMNEEGMKVPDSNCLELMTEAPTPLSPKGLQFRQKLFPPQNLPSPIPRPLPHSSSSPSSSPIPCPAPGLHPVPMATGPQRGTLMAPPSPKSHQQLMGSLHHDKHLSPFKSERNLKMRNKGRFHFRGSAASSSPNGPGGNEMGGAPRFSSSCRQVISSPLAKLSMSSSLEEGPGGSGIGGGSLVSSTTTTTTTGFLGSSLSKHHHLHHHHIGETMAMSSKEDSTMESDNEGGPNEGGPNLGGPNLEELPVVVTPMVADKALQA